MLRFCANLGFLFPELPFLDRFAAASRAGFAGVEFASPYEYPAAELRSRLRDNGLTQVLINSPAGNRAAGERGFACLPGRETHVPRQHRAGARLCGGARLPARACDGRGAAGRPAV